jgi:hypothetical protein
MECVTGSLCGLQAGAASRKDEDRSRAALPALTTLDRLRAKCEELLRTSALMTWTLLR